MSKEEIKYEITKVLDHFSDKALLDLLSYLKKVEITQPISLLSGGGFKKILDEDESLLEKLAQ